MSETNLKKVGVITLYYKNYNLGGLLQAFAIQNVIEQMGFDCEVISYSKENEISLKKRLYNNNTVCSRIKKYCRNGTLFKNLFRKLLSSMMFRYFAVRKSNFEVFMFEKIKHSKEIYTKENIKQSNNIYDNFVCGSDQVWNPKWSVDTQFLDFVNNNKVKFSYAASIGVNNITDKEKAHMKPLIKSLDHISVREESGMLLLNTFIEKDVFTVLDPTLLLDQQKWSIVSVKPKIKEDYIFVYLLGKNNKHRDLIKIYAEKLDLKIVTVPHSSFSLCLADINFADINLNDVGPAEFLGLIQNASMVFTDSFHGSIFSIIFERKFFVLKRNSDNSPESMNSRVVDLLSKLDLNDRLISADKQIENTHLNKDIDYNFVNEKLLILKNESMNFLMNALNTEKSSI